MSQKKGVKNNTNAQLQVRVAEAVAEILTDPDFGKELSEKAKQRLSALTNKQANNLTPLTEI